MKNNKTSESKFKTKEFFNSFVTNPNCFYEKLICKKSNFISNAKAIRFWNLWSDKREDFLCSKSDEVKIAAKRIDQLKILVDFENCLISKKENLIEQRQDFKISKKRFLIQSFYLTEEGFPKEIEVNFRHRFADILKAYKLALKDEWFVEEFNYTFSEPEINFVNQLQSIYVELVYIEKAYEYFILGKFDILESKYIFGEKPISLYSLKLTDNAKQSDNCYLNSKLKQIIKEEFYKTKANNEVTLSKTYDEKINSLESLLQESIPTFNPELILPLYDYLLMEKEGLSAYKDAIINIYFPQEEIDIYKISITHINQEIPLINLVYAIGALSAYSVQYIIADGHRNEGVKLRKTDVFEILSGYKEWRDLNLNLKEQEYVLSLIVSVNNKLPFSPLVEINDDTFLLIPVSFLEDKGYSRVFYDYLITDLLFDQSFAQKNKETQLYQHQLRESAVINGLVKEVKKSINECIVVPGFEWPKDDGCWGRNGEIDIVIYFPLENVIYLIEVKLNNTLTKNTFGKLKWMKDKIYKGADSASYQLQKDVNFFRHKLALPIILNELGLDKDHSFSPQIIPLILTDVFWLDNSKIVINALSNEKVNCISVFQFSQLLKGNTNVFSEIKTILPESGPGKWLIDQISSQDFWKGLEEHQSKLRDYLLLRSEGLPGILSLEIKTIV